MTLNSQAYQFKAALLIQLCKLVEYSKCLPFKWNSKLGTLTLTNIGSKSRKSLLFHCYVVYHTLQAVWWFNQQGKSITIEKLQAGIVTIGFIAYSCMMHAAISSRSETTLYLNGLLHFTKNSDDEMDKRKYESSLIGKLNVLFAFGIYFAAILSAPCVTYGFHWGEPCKASLTGYWILPECHGGMKSSWMNILIKQGLLLGNIAFLLFGAHGTIHVTAILQCLGTMILLDCLKIFCVRVSKNGSPQGSQDAYLVFRKIQVLGNLNNAIQQGVMSTGILIAAVIFHASSLTMIVLVTKESHWNEDSQLLTSFAFFILIAIVMLLAICVMYGCMSMLFIEYKLIFRELKRHEIKLLETGVFRRLKAWRAGFVKSCSPIQVKFGLNNFVEELTPLNAVNYALSLAVNMLLLKG